MSKYIDSNNFDHKYLYPNPNGEIGTSVYINKFDIRNRQELERIEAQCYYRGLSKLPDGDFDYKHLCAIHKALFGEVYEWAGQAREVNLSKNDTMFCRIDYIEVSAKQLFTKLKQENYLTSFTAKEKIIERLAYYFVEINAIHPFREGNGRTNRAFIELLADKNGYKLDWKIVDKDEYIQASIASYKSDNDLLENIFNKIISKKQEHKVTIDQYSHSPKLDRFLKNQDILQELNKSNPNVELLKQYRGFGGLKEIFIEKQYDKEREMLKHDIAKVFNNANVGDIFTALKTSTSSAYFTPTPLINFIYHYVGQVCNFKGGDILEPACGIGAFFEHIPENIKNTSKVIGVECDLITAKIAQVIYPNIEIIHSTIQDYDFRNKKFDLIIGNPPFSAERVQDKYNPDLSNIYSIHHYFIAKCERLLKPEGILAFVMPSYFMDLPRGHTRDIVDKESKIIDVVRLPENLFEFAKVTADIVFLRKSGNRVHDITKVVPFVQNNNKDWINDYWNKNPHRIKGNLNLKWVEKYGRFVPACSNKDKKQLLNYLNNCTFSQETIANYQNIIKKQALILPVQEKINQFHGRQYLRNLGIDSNIIDNAEKYAFLKYDKDTVLFIGYDQNKEIRNIISHSINNQQESRQKSENSESQYIPILQGNNNHLWIVDNEVSALAVQNIADKQNQGLPTIAVIDKVMLKSYLELPHIKDIVAKTSTITLANDVDEDHLKIVKNAVGRGKEISLWGLDVQYKNIAELNKEMKQELKKQKSEYSLER